MIVSVNMAENVKHAGLRNAFQTRFTVIKINIYSSGIHSMFQEKKTYIRGYRQKTKHYHN